MTLHAYHKLFLAFAICVGLWLATPAWAGDGVPVTSMSTLRSAASSSGPYSSGANTINYGVGDNVRITAVNAAGNMLTRSAISKPTIAIQRKDNANVQGERLTLFYPGLLSGTTVNIEGDEAASMEIAMNDDYITSGGLDVFLNVDTGVEKANNIERVDFVVANGISLPSTAALLSEIGTVANEKHGNNTYKIGLITSLDAFGEPASYAPLKTVQGNVDYGNMGRPQNSSGANIRNLYMRNGPTSSGGSNGSMAYIRNDTNFIGLSFVSFAALGASPGQTVYGYSLFANDMTNALDLVGLSNAPTTTSGSINGGDIYGGTFAVFSTPAAEAETSEGTAELLAVKTIDVYDPTNVGLYAVPGNEVVYRFDVTNTGTGTVDNDSMFLVDIFPNDLQFFNGDFDGVGSGVGAVEFTPGSSTLNFDPVNDIGFALAGAAPTSFANCNHSPISGYVDVAYVCFRLSGAMAHGTPNPNFILRFRARIK